MTDPANHSTDDVSQTLGLDQRGRGQRHLRMLLLAGVILIIVLGAGAYVLSGNDTTVRYESAAVRRGDLTVTVTATGDLQPVNQVDVGTEISGTVESVAVDFNDRVQVGDVLARLDTDQLNARFRQSQAALELAQARIAEAQATVVETRLKHQRAQELARKGLNSQEDRDAADAGYARAQAAFAVAQAQVAQAQAQLDADRTSREKAVIHSPIDGIVLKRQIEPGQTVAASLQTPVLFTLAENLAQMELHVAVDEADVGQIREGQRASFTVDAYPDRVFPAAITQVRYAPQTVDGVVTYETVLTVDNTELLLRPGMTATAEVVVEERRDVVLVPNAALRFVPPSTAPASSASGGLLGRLLPRPPRSSGNRRDTADARNGMRVWELRDGRPQATAVKTGATDGQFTELVSEEIPPGTEVLVDAVVLRK